MGEFFYVKYATQELLMVATIAVSLKNQETHVYWLDQLEEPKHPDIWHFVTSRWDMLLAMSLLLSMFVFSELHRPS